MKRTSSRNFASVLQWHCRRGNIIANKMLVISSSGEQKSTEIKRIKISFSCTAKLGINKIRKKRDEK